MCVHDRSLRESGLQVILLASQLSLQLGDGSLFLPSFSRGDHADSYGAHGVCRLAWCCFCSAKNNNTHRSQLWWCVGLSLHHNFSWDVQLSLSRQLQTTTTERKLKTARICSAQLGTSCCSWSGWTTIRAAGLSLALVRIPSCAHFILCLKVSRCSRLCQRTCLQPVQ